MGVAGAELIIIHVFLNTSTFHMVYLLCEKCNLDFRYKIHYKNMSSDWAKYLGMCLWRYYVLLTFEILKHEYLICEECNLVFRYKIHYKNMSSDWAKNLGMCLWRYYVPLIFEILKYLGMCRWRYNLTTSDFQRKWSSDFQKSIFRGR